MKALFVCILAMTFSSMPTTNPLGPYRWENRLILVVAGEEPHLAQEQLARFDTQPNEVQDRDLLVFKIDQGRVNLFGKQTEISASEVAKTYGLDLSKFSVLLIGKDGGVKFRSTEVVAPLKIYGMIDQMPMRRAEMRSKSN